MSDEAYILTVICMKVKELFDFRKIASLSAAVAGIMIAVVFSKECSRGILSGIMFCVQALVPSLFFFMAVSAFTVKSGAALIVSRPLGKVTRALFGLPYPSMAVILLSVIGGYPVGARAAAMMYEDGHLSAEQARKTVYTAVCAGPGFLLNFVGTALLGSKDAGILLLTAQLVSLTVTGIIIGKAIKCDVDAKRGANSCNSPNLLISSVNDASKATFAMCAMVIVCSAAIEVIAAISPDKTVTDICAALTEITTGCGMLCGRYPLALIAFFIGFGGISVHLQIYASLGKLTINKKLFFLFRIIQGIITSAATYILLMVFPLEVSVFNSTDSTLTAAKSATLAGSAALILCSLIFMATINKLTVRR